jgi:hypothetical protein
VARTEFDETTDVIGGKNNIVIDYQDLIMITQTIAQRIQSLVDGTTPPPVRITANDGYLADCF